MFNEIIFQWRMRNLVLIMADKYIIKIRGAIYHNVNSKSYPIRVDESGQCYIDGLYLTNNPECIRSMRSSLSHSLRGSDCYAICELFVDKNGYVTVTDSFSTDHYSEFAAVVVCKKVGKILASIFN